MKGPSPAYATLSHSKPAKPSPLQTEVEQSTSWTSQPSMVFGFAIPNFKILANAATAPSGTACSKYPEISSDSVATEPVVSKFEKSFTGVPSTPAGSLNAFETTQFKLLDKLLSSGEVKSEKIASSSRPSGPQSSDSRSDEMHIFRMGQKQQVHSVPLNKFWDSDLRRAYKLPVPKTGQFSFSQVPSHHGIAVHSLAGLGSPKKKSRTSRYLPSSQRRVHHKVSSTDPDRSSFSFKPGSESERPNPYQFTSNSEENISTDFSSTEWKGQFEAGNYFAPDPSRARALSGNRSGRRSPIRKRTMNKSTTGNASSIPPIDPEILAQPRDDDGYAASPGGTKFKPEEWAQTFKPETFVFPPTGQSAGPQRRAPLRRPSKMGSGSSKGPSISKTAGNAAIVDEDSSSDEPLYMKTTSDEPTGVDSPNAMDIDPPPEVRQPRPRNVPVEPSNPAWRDQANGSAFMGPEPPLPPRSPNANSSKSRARQESDELKAKLDDLKNVEPLQQQATGLHSFNDLSSSLPWTSKAADSVPLSHSISTGRLNLPLPPKSPMPPAITAESMRPMPSEWTAYMKRFQAYMKAWRDFDIKMVHHFVARREQVDAMGEEWWLEFGDARLEKYEKYLSEDKTVMAWWEEACRRHTAAMEELKGWKGVMREGPGSSRLV